MANHSDVPRRVAEVGRAIEHEQEVLHRRATGASRNETRLAPCAFGARRTPAWGPTCDAQPAALRRRVPAGCLAVGSTPAASPSGLRRLRPAVSSARSRRRRGGEAGVRASGSGRGEGGEARGAFPSTTLFPLARKLSLPAVNKPKNHAGQSACGRWTIDPQGLTAIPASPPCRPARERAKRVWRGHRIPQDGLRPNILCTPVPAVWGNVAGRGRIVHASRRTRWDLSSPSTTHLEGGLPGA